jgi:hypothetical protein
VIVLISSDDLSFLHNLSTLALERQFDKQAGLGGRLSRAVSKEQSSPKLCHSPSKAALTARMIAATCHWPEGIEAELFGQSMTASSEESRAKLRLDIRSGEMPS